MIVNYKAESGVRGVALSDLPGKEGKVGSVNGQIVLLVPGWNEIPSEIWPNAEVNMEMDYQAGLYEYKMKEVEVDGKTVRYEQPLQDIRADIGRKIVEGCYNPATLERWQNDSKLSGELRNIVDIQIKKYQSM
jgi:hypothetical protein